jgi:hypothetical protein
MGKKEKKKMLPDILEMLLDILNRISGKVCSETPRTWGFDTGSDTIVQSHVGQTHPVGLFDMASDGIVQSHVGQTCRTSLSDIASDDDV